MFSQLAAQFEVFGHFFAAGRRDLQQRDVTLQIRMFLEQTAECVEALGQSFRVVQTIDADEHHAAVHRIRRSVSLVCDAAARWPSVSRCAVSMLIGNAPTRKCDRSLRCGRRSRRTRRVPVRNIARTTACRSRSGSRRDRTSVNARHQIAMMRQRRQQLRRRHRRVQEETDAAGDAARTQRGAERNEMIVVHPDRVVGFDRAARVCRRTSR